MKPIFFISRVCWPSSWEDPDLFRSIAFWRSARVGGLDLARMARPPLRPWAAFVVEEAV
jgi:hypothetical protein